MRFTHISLITALAMSATPVAAQISVLDCGGLGDVDVRIEVFADWANVIEEMGMDSGNSRTVTRLDRVRSGSGAVFQGEGYEFVSHAGRDELFPEGEAPMTCMRAGMDEVTPDAAGGAIAMNQPAMSLGGRVRAGPGMEYENLGSIHQGTQITLLENTGVMMNGYPWFGIRVFDGQTGYQWGGIICDPHGRVQGVFETCD